MSFPKMGGGSTKSVFFPIGFFHKKPPTNQLFGVDGDGSQQKNLGTRVLTHDHMAQEHHLAPCWMVSIMLKN